MTRISRSTAGAAGVAVLMLLPTASMAGANHSLMSDTAAEAPAAGDTRLAHMSGPGGGPGMMAPSEDRHPYPCQNYQRGYGMGRGGAGPEMMGPGMMGRGMMGRGMMGRNFDNAPDFDDRVVPSRDLTVDDVRHFLTHRLEMHGNKRLKIGDVQAADDDRIIGDITTVDGSLVQRLEVDRHTGQMRSIEEK